jgi:hypothetical protein
MASVAPSYSPTQTRTRLPTTTLALERSSARLSRRATARWLTDCVAWRAATAPLRSHWPPLPNPPGAGAALRRGRDPRPCARSPAQPRWRPWRRRHRRILGLLGALAPTAAVPLGGAAQKPKDNKVTLAAPPNRSHSQRPPRCPGKSPPDHASAEVPCAPTRSQRATPTLPRPRRRPTRTAISSSRGSCRIATRATACEPRPLRRSRALSSTWSCASTRACALTSTPRVGQRVKSPGLRPLSTTAVWCGSSADV